MAVAVSIGFSRRPLSNLNSCPRRDGDFALRVLIPLRLVMNRKRMIVTNPQIVRTQGRASFCISENLFGVTWLPPTEELVTMITRLPELLICFRSPPNVAKMVW